MWHLWYLLWCYGEAQVLPSAGRLEHPHPSLLQLPSVGDVLEAWEPWEVDVQLHPVTQTLHQLLRLYQVGEVRQLHQPVHVCVYNICDSASV